MINPAAAGRAAILLLLTGCTPPAVVATPTAHSVFTPNPLVAQLESIFDEPSLAHARIGVQVRSISTGEVIYERDAERLLTPASNQKILSGAAALETLGPEYRYRTSILAGGETRAGVLNGPLVIVGTGDPSFGARFHDDPVAPFRAWADSLRAHGITRIAGGVIAVDTAFADGYLGEGWMWDDLGGNSSSEFGALQFNDGLIDLDVFPSSTIGQPGVVVLTPATQFLRIVNETTTVPAGGSSSIRADRTSPGSFVLRGTVAAGSQGVSRSVAVGEPGLYFASVLRETLREQGIAVEGPPVHYSQVGLESASINRAFPIFAYSSPPMREILTAMMKPSQNQIAETLLRTVGREIGGSGTAVRGAGIVDSLFAAWEFENTQLRMADGSGLSRYDLVSPALLTELLLRMDRSFYRDDWLASMPVGGRDGTLENRMKNPPLLDNVLAKTGSLSNVRALSGYLTTQTGERLAFSIIANGYLAPTAEVDRVVEAALSLIATSR